MSDSSGDPENRVSIPRTDNSDATDPTNPFELRSVVVRYATRPDRCTIYPRRESCCEHVDAWLSADADAFVPLEKMR